MSDEDDKLTGALLDQVTANLPNMVGIQLRKRLEQAERDATKAKNVDRLETENSQLRVKIESLTRAEAEIKAREAAVATKERQLEIKGAVAEEREKNMKELAAYPLQVLDRIFRDRTIMTNLSLSGNLPGGGYANLVGTASKSD